MKAVLGMLGALVLLAGVSSGAKAAELSAPAAASWSSARFDVVVRGPEGLIYHKWYDESANLPGGWSDWAALGAPPVGAASSPTVTSPGNGVLQMFVRGNDNQIWYDHWTQGQGSAPGGWSGWNVVPNTGNATWAPAVTNGSDALPDLFYTGTDRAVWYTHQLSSGAWTSPVSLGGQANASPAATTTAGGRIQLVIHTADGRVHLRFADSSTNWIGWGTFANTDTSMGPAVSTDDAGNFNMFLRGCCEGTMYRVNWNPSISDFVGPSGIPNTNMLSSAGAARLHLYMRDADGNVLQRYYSAIDGWRGPRSLGQPGSNGRLYREIGDPAVYYMNEGTRYWVVSPAAAAAYNLDLTTVQIVPNGSLAFIPRGVDIDELVTEDGTLEEGPEVPATSADLQADPNYDGNASAAAATSCKQVVNRLPLKLAVVGTRIGWVKLTSRFCFNAQAHTTWTSDRWMALTHDLNDAFEVAGYDIERFDDKTSYNVSRRDAAGNVWRRGGIHMHMRYRVTHCMPGISIVIGCTRGPDQTLINYGYFDGRTGRARA